MKKIIVVLCMIFPLVVFSQRPEKIFLKILDVYLENELPRVKSRFHLDKDEIVVSCSVDTTMKPTGYLFLYTIYELKTFPKIDSLTMYKGVRMLVSYPKEMEKKLSKHFQPINESREVQDTLIRIETVSNVTVQMNDKFEIFYFITPDDTAYYNGLKKKRIKFSEKVISISPLPR